MKTEIIEIRISVSNEDKASVNTKYFNPFTKKEYTGFFPCKNLDEAIIKAREYKNTTNDNFWCSELLEINVNYFDDKGYRNYTTKIK